MDVFLVGVRDFIFCEKDDTGIFSDSLVLVVLCEKVVIKANRNSDNVRDEETSVISLGSSRLFSVHEAWRSDDIKKGVNDWRIIRR